MWTVNASTPPSTSADAPMRPHSPASRAPLMLRSSLRPRRARAGLIPGEQTIELVEALLDRRGTHFLLCDQRAHGVDRRSKIGVGPARQAEPASRRQEQVGDEA